MIDLKEKFALKKVNNRTPGGYIGGIGVMLTRPGEEACLGRQACSIADEFDGMELDDLSFPAVGTIVDAADAVKSFLQDHRVKAGARIALQSLERSLRRGELVMGCDALVGNECNSVSRRWPSRTLAGRRYGIAD